MVVGSGVRDFFLTVEVFLAPYLYAVCRLVFGTLYPAYASYKAVRTKNVKEYVSTISIMFFLKAAIDSESGKFTAGGGG